MDKKRIVWFVMMVLVMVVIFAFSNQSVEKSHEISNAVAESMHVEGNQWYEPAGKPLLLGLNFRKMAHIGLYALLGFTAWNTVARLWQSMCICYCYAVFDEIHQFFISGRTASITDTFIDAIGFGTAIIFCFVLRKIISKHKK